jgi:hypothetical protein
MRPAPSAAPPIFLSSSPISLRVLMVLLRPEAMHGNVSHAGIG